MLVKEGITATSSFAYAANSNLIASISERSGRNRRANNQRTVCLMNESMSGLGLGSAGMMDLADMSTRWERSRRASMAQGSVWTVAAGATFEVCRVCVAG